MPITVQPAPHLTTVGPGLQINLRSDFIGPFPSDAVWQVALTVQPDQVEPVLFYTRPCTGPIISLMVLHAEEWSETRQAWWPNAGGQINVHAQIATQSGVIDSGALSSTWDATSGIGWMLQASAQGGFTAEDRAQLQLAVDQTTTNLLVQGVPTDLTHVPVGRLPNGPPIPWGERVGPFNLQGRGVLDLPAQGVGGYFMGIRWFYTVIPPGWGMTPGAIDEFDGRPAQLVPIWRLESGEEIGSPILNTSTSGGYEPLSQFGFTGKIAFDVAPGWTTSVYVYRILGSG